MLIRAVFLLELPRCHGFAHSLFLADREFGDHRYLVTLEHGSLSLNSLANSLGNLGTRKKTYNFNVLSKNDLIVKLKFQE